MPCSVVIPAHNETAVIGRCLGTLLNGAAPGELEILVIANGCTDDTAGRTRALGHRDVRVIETDVGSKPHALNLGDSAATAFPRFYIDADVQMGISSFRKVVEAIEQPGILAAAPVPHFDLTGSSWAVKAFYRVWSTLPYFRSGMIGSGVYAVSEAGRRRFETFPAIIADDAFVRLHFKPHERLLVQDCFFTVTAPRTLWSLIKIKTRSHLGNVELRMKYPHLTENEEVRHGPALARMARNPLRWPDLAVYVLVKYVTRYRAQRQFRQGKLSLWERDESSRTRGARGAGAAAAVRNA